MQELNINVFVKNNNLAHPKQKISRRDTYAPLFCAPEFYQFNQKNFQKIVAASTTWSNVENLVLWTLLLTCLRRKGDWFGGLRPEALPAEFLSEIQIYPLFKQLEINWPKSLSRLITLSAFTSSVRLKPLPDSALRGLHFFLQKKYPLEILCYEPAPNELLEIQVRGSRVITFENDFQNWPSKSYGLRDPLSFWLHDFIHADHFFRDDQNRAGQIGFYIFVQKILAQRQLELLLLNKEFNDQFSYLIADMNSHPVHLFKTLKALIDLHPKTDDSTWGKMCNSWEAIFHRALDPANGLAALRKINTHLFSYDDATALLQFSQNLYNLS